MQVISRKEAKAQGLKVYYTGTPCKNGHVSKRYVSSGKCASCRKKYAEKNKDRISKRMNVYAKNYYYENKKEIQEKKNSYQFKRYHQDPIYRMQTIIRRSIHRIIKITNIDKRSNNDNILGYSSLELKNHIESFMLEGMTWDNYGSEWHIDHMVSVAQMVKNGITDPSIINALDNLRPMWAEHNLNKGDKDFETWISENPDLQDVYSKWVGG